MSEEIISRSQYRRLECQAPQKLETEFFRLRDENKKLGKALAACRQQRNMIHAEYCDDPKCMVAPEAEIQAILGEGK